MTIEININIPTMQYVLTTDTGRIMVIGNILSPDEIEVISNKIINFSTMPEELSKRKQSQLMEIQRKIDELQKEKDALNADA